MRRLMLLRHAKTEHEASSGRDQDRRLDNRGRHDAAEIGGWIGHHPPFPDCVLVSHAIRAHQTWEVAWEAMKDLAPEPQVELMPELYGADAAELLQIIRSASETDPQRLLLVGHNPGMHELALALAGSGDRRRTRGARRQPADIGTCDLRLRHRRLGRRGIPPRQTGAVRQPQAAETRFGRIATRAAPRRKPVKLC